MRSRASEQPMCARAVERIVRNPRTVVGDAHAQPALFARKLQRHERRLCVRGRVLQAPPAPRGNSDRTLAADTADVGQVGRAFGPVRSVNSSQYPHCCLRQGPCCRALGRSSSMRRLLRPTTVAANRAHTALKRTASARVAAPSGFAPPEPLETTSRLTAVVQGRARCAVRARDGPSPRRLPS